MIKFFRKIRQNMIKENKVNKYMLYAIGEIILVVIGILIAIQINNWNEKRKIKIKEIKSLVELKNDLIQNINDINGNIAAFNTCKTSNEIIIHHIENNIPYNDSLSYHFSMLYPFISFTINQTTYETLKQNGFDLITNDSIRYLTSNLYSNRFKAYQTFENTYMVNHYLDQIKPMFISEFTSFEYRSHAQPKNYSQFIKNTDYKQIMNHTIDICKNFISIQTGLKTEAQGLIERIDKEIELN